MNKTNEELVQEAGSTVIGTPSGLKAQQAQAELNKRLIESMDSLKTSLDENNIATNRYNKVLLGFTVIMALLALFQVLLTVMARDDWSLPVKLLFIVIPVLIIVIVFREKTLKAL